MLIDVSAHGYFAWSDTHLILHAQLDQREREKEGEVEYGENMRRGLRKEGVVELSILII